MGYAGEGVFGAGAGLHREDAGSVAVCDAGVGVGEVDAHALLAEYERADAGFGGCLFKGVEGYDAHKVDALLLEDAGDEVGSGGDWHWGAPWYVGKWDIGRYFAISETDGLVYQVLLFGFGTQVVHALHGDSGVFGGYVWFERID